MTAVTCVSVAQLSLDVDIWCISSIYGITDVTSITYSIIMGVFVTTTSVVTAVLLALAWREVLRLQRTVLHRTAGVELAVTYVTSITIIFTSVMLIPSVITVIVGFSHGPQYSGIISWAACYLQTSYTLDFLRHTERLLFEFLFLGSAGGTQ